MKEMLTFVSRTVIKRTRLGGRQSVKHEGPRTPAAPRIARLPRRRLTPARDPRPGYLCYGHLRADGLGVLIVADGEYPARVAFGNAQVLMDRCDAEHGCAKCTLWPPPAAAPRSRGLPRCAGTGGRR